MTTLQEAALMVLAVLEDINKLSLSPGGIALPGEIDTAMDLLRTVLDAKSEAELFGWTDCAKDDEGAVPLYEAPPQRKPLSDEDIEKLMTDTWGNASIAPQSATAFARLIERAHGIGGEE